jgi:hypothetical protein
VSKTGTLRTLDGVTEIHGSLNCHEGGMLSFTADGSRSAAHFSSSEWGFVSDVPVEPTLPYGIYVSKIYADRPESGVKWSYTGSRGWRALRSTAYDGDVSAHADHPRDFYAANGGHADWWDRIVRLVAETPATR